MLRKTILASLLVALPLMAGCASSGSNNVVVAPPKPVLAQPDSKLTARCLDPVKNADNGFEKAWATDRKNLADCRDSKQALVDFYQFRDNELSK